MMWPPDPDTAGELAQEARRKLSDACERVLGGRVRDLPCTPLVSPARPGPLLVAGADEDGTLLVVGGGSHGAAHRALTGSVSRYCLRHARCPVLVVPPGRPRTAQHGTTARPAAAQADHASVPSRPCAVGTGHRTALARRPDAGRCTAPGPRERTWSHTATTPPRTVCASRWPCWWPPPARWRPSPSPRSTTSSPV
ncbi:hypothetical protein CTZ27_28495 [Streptomyces griseocarneus]|nr:hypothetical protein CTZ27_28495 [Streptomyces griseocarneus]